MIDRTEAIIGTHIRIAVNSNDPKAASAVEAAFDEVRTIERRFSRFIDNNELSQLNASIGQWVRVAPDLHAILRYGKELENLTDGAFSLGVKGILESWGYNIRYELAREYARTEAVGYDLDDKGVCLRGPIEIGALGK
ncbi:MAG TPA: FAD:protein FMN transferase [bacterium]|nr:FAD:protein FMN transferase [bacterium]